MEQGLSSKLWQAARLGVAPIKPLLVLAAIVSLVLTCAGCGGASDRASSVSGAASTQTGQGVPGQSASTSSISSRRSDLRSLEGDEDDDDGPGEEVGHDPNDPDTDRDNDRVKRRGFYDRDDLLIRAYGHAANAADERALTTLVKRYSAAAVAEDGTAACSMFTAVVAKSIPEDYGRGSAGPSYLHSATTCPGVTTLLFKHIHGQVSAPMEITAIRVDGDQALVLLGAKNIPASYLAAQREGGVWKSTALLVAPLS